MEQPTKRSAASLVTEKEGAYHQVRERARGSATLSAKLSGLVSWKGAGWRRMRHQCQASTRAEKPTRPSAQVAGACVAGARRVASWAWTTLPASPNPSTMRAVVPMGPMSLPFHCSRCFQRISMVTMKAMPTPDEASYTTPTSKPLTLRAKESKVRLSAEKTTIESPGRSFENPCESFKEMTAVSSKKRASMRKIPFIRDLLFFLCQCLLSRLGFYRLHCFSHAKALFKDCRVLRRHPRPSSCRCGMRPLVHCQQLIELPGGHRLSEQGANPQRPGGVVDDIVRKAPARHYRQHLSGGSHPACAGHRCFVSFRAVLDGGELDHLLLFPQGERPRWRGLIGRDMGVEGFEHDDITQPTRLELIGGGGEQTQASPTTRPAQQRPQPRPTPLPRRALGPP